jgi:predicted ATPase/DNA-binding CsgD family transcriptional regulator
MLYIQKVPATPPEAEDGDAPVHVDDWLDIRQRHASGEAIKAIARDKGISRNTVRRALAADAPPSGASRPARGSVADAAEPAVLELLAADPHMTAAEIARRIGWQHSMTVLKDRIRLLRPGLDPGPASPLTGLPPELSTFVGREEELATIRQALQDRRLVTLTGPGGVGKTRLAYRATASAKDGFADGVRLVELAALRDPDLLPQTVLDALHISDADRSTGDPVPMVVGHLRHRHLLLVLDNCEHLLEAAAGFAVALLAAAPRLHLLVTGRQALGISGEHVIEVRPLRLPPDTPADAAAALAHPAIALFADRAAAVRPGFCLDGPTAADAAELCRRLDGIPLAIELAAVRMRVLSVRQLLDRLEDRFALLTHGDPTRPARQRTLQDTIAWSHDLCTPPERALWSRATVFPGTFDLDALAAVCTDAEYPPDALLDSATGLAAKSLLVRESDDNGGVRFRMLETIREFGHEQLAADHERMLRSRHRDHYVEMACALRRHWYGPQQHTWARRMRAERANLRAALEFSLRDPGGHSAALRLVGEPWFLWATSLSMTEHRRWLHRVLDAAPERSPEWARTLVTCGFVASLQGDQGAAQAMVAEASDLAHAAGDKATVAYATHASGMIAFFCDDFPAAAGLLQDAERRYRCTGSPADLLGALDVHVGLLNISRGRLDDAAGRLSATCASSEAAGESWILSYATDGLGFVALMRGDLPLARRHARRSLELTTRFEDTIGLSLALDLAAWTAAAGGEHERAAVLLGAASARWFSFGQQLYGSPDWQARRDHYQQQARRCLGEAAFEHAFRRGTLMTRPDMIGYALGRSEPTRLPGSLTGLTAREREVAAMVADGLTNRQIAERLVVSHRTVEGHIGRILTKLGLRRRTELAAWMWRQARGSGGPPGRRAAV